VFYHNANGQDNVINPSTKTTLRFAYKEPPYGPIKEKWAAVVTKRSKTQNTVTEQKISESKFYEAGNYHIEINTFPIMIYNLDLDPNYESVISISHPGYAKFVFNESTGRNVALYQPLGDQYLCFYSLDLNDPRSQYFQMQPGDYQVHYRNGTKRNSEQKVSFKIKPGKETSVNLN
jgi:hypothetical protein